MSRTRYDRDIIWAARKESGEVRGPDCCRFAALGKFFARCAGVKIPLTIKLPREAGMKSPSCRRSGKNAKTLASKAGALRGPGTATPARQTEPHRGGERAVRFLIGNVDITAEDAARMVRETAAMR